MLKRMGPYESVFNCHINNARERAYAELEKQNPGWAREVRTVEKAGDGAMAIFQMEPKPSTAAFVVLVTYFVNEDRE